MPRDGPIFTAKYMMQHPSFGGMGNPELSHSPTQQIGTAWHRSQSDEMEYAGYAKPKKRGRRQSWMSITPFPAF